MFPISMNKKVTRISKSHPSYFVQINYYLTLRWNVKVPLPPGARVGIVSMYLLTAVSVVNVAVLPTKKVMTAPRVGSAAVLGTAVVVVPQLLVSAAPSSVITMLLAFKIELVPDPDWAVERLV